LDATVTRRNDSIGVAARWARNPFYNKAFDNMRLRFVTLEQIRL
jgi:hypothetical protein